MFDKSVFLSHMYHLRRERTILNCFNIYILSVTIDMCYNSIWTYLSHEAAKQTQEIIILSGLSIVLGAAVVCFRRAILYANDIEAMRLAQRYCISFCFLLTAAGLKNGLDI